MTVTAPKDGAELIGLLRCALEHTAGPFSLRYPRDKAPGETPPAAEVAPIRYGTRSEEHTSELQSPCNLVCRLLLEKKKKIHYHHIKINVQSSTIISSTLPSVLYLHLPRLHYLIDYHLLNILALELLTELVLHQRMS